MTNKQELDHRIRMIFESLGGFGSAREVSDAVLSSMSDDERNAVARMGIDTRVRNALRAVIDGDLPFSQAINGTYVQRSLWAESDYRFVARRAWLSGEKYRSRARRYVDECADHHGVDISDELAS